MIKIISRVTGSTKGNIINIRAKIAVERANKENFSFVHLDKTKEEKPQPQKIEYEKPKIIEPPKPVHVREEVAKIAGVSSGTVARSPTSSPK